MNDFERIRAVKRAAQARLLSIPGVHSVGIGAKYVGGRNTAEPAIIVFVVKKKPMAELPPYEVVPPEIDGIKTDVVEEERPVLHAKDDTSYRPLDGGIQIHPGKIGGFFDSDHTGVGTLGCIALTEGPDPKVVAVTCQHVVMWDGKPTDLIVDVSPNQRTLTFSGTNTPGSLVVLVMIVMPAGPGPSQDVELFWVTDNTDTPATVASKVASGINGLGNPAVSATATGVQVTITWGPGFIVLVPNVNGDGTGTFVYDVPFPDSAADLHASIVANVITLSGRVSGEYYGVYTNVHPGAGRPSAGVFTPLTRGDSLTSAASSIADTVNAHITGVTASASDSQITITGSQFIECYISHDVRVGQPDNTFCSKCCSVCNDRIGRVIDARLDIDTALIQLDPGLKYKAEIEGIDVVSGTYQVTEPDAISGTYVLKKRGRTTRRTSGTLYAIDVDGDIGSEDVKGPPEKLLFHRHYTGAIKIKSGPAGPDCQPGDPYYPACPFSTGGDSGSAVLNASNQVVGILFGGGDLFTNATPIDAITSALKIRIATATAPGVVLTVPTPAGTHAMTPHSAIAENATVPTAPVGDRLREIEREITAMPAGERYASLVRRHFSEVYTLVNKNRRVATVWHRNGGPQLIQRLIQMFQRPDEALLVEIDGKPLTECLARIQEILMRYSSPSLSADLRTYAPGLGRLAGLTYSQILLTLQTWEGD